jgi:hypothetical protein
MGCYTFGLVQSGSGIGLPGKAQSRKRLQR